jgi:hypothetical protein
VIAMSRFVVLPLLLVALLGLIFVLPSRGKVAESAVRMDLPEFVGRWHGVKRVESQLERDTLAADTEFSKTDYFREAPGSFQSDGSPDFDCINVMIVLSGYDINNSIHRPERCLPAQGHKILNGSNSLVPLADVRPLKVRRLTSQVPIRLREDAASDTLMNSLSYYVFVGHDSTTHDHYARTFKDMRDRLVLGRDQRWAYVTLSTLYGKLPWSGRVVTEQQAEQQLVEFAGQLADQIIDWSQIKH